MFESGGGGGGGTSQRSIGEALPSGPNPYLFYTILTKRCHFT